jgi:MFS family permease
VSPLLADFEPLRIPGFRRYVFSSSLVYICLWMYMMAVAWQLLEITGSAAVLGLLFMAWAIPLPFAAIPAGALTDRLGPRNLMALALGAEAVCILATGLVVGSGHVSVPIILLLAFLLGTAEGFYLMPAQVLVGRIVRPPAMGSAIALGMLAIGFGRIAGGPIGGGIVALAGPSAALVLAGIGLCAAGLVTMTLPRLRGIGGGARLSRSDLGEGLAWVRSSAASRPIIALGMIAGLFVWPYLGMLAVITRDLLNGDPTALGLLTAAGGVGAVAAALLAGIGARLFGPSKLLVAGVVSAGILLALLGLARWLPLALALAMLLGGALVVHTAMSSLSLQSLAAVGIRGRVMAIYGIAFFGVLPLGAAVAGMLSDLWGVGSTLVLFGSATVVMALPIGVASLRSGAFDALGPGRGENQTDDLPEMPAAPGPAGEPVSGDP